MGFRRGNTLLPLLLLLGGFPCPGFLLPLPVPECRGEVLINVPNNADIEDDADLEEELLTLTNRQRIQQGLQPLTLDSVLTRVAREHSQEMAEQGYISHDLPSGNLKSRMYRAGYSFEIARENLARARTVPMAQRLLINSPEHRDNILAADVTRVGIGITRHKPPVDKYLYVTQIFAAPQRRYPQSIVQNTAMNQFARLQWKNGSLPLQPDPLLESLASHSVTSLEIPVKREDLKSLLADSANELIKHGRTDWSRLEVAVQLLHNPQNLRIPDQAGEKGTGRYGIAVRQVTDDRNQPAFLVLTLIGFIGEDILVQNK